MNIFYKQQPKIKCSNNSTCIFKTTRTQTDTQYCEEIPNKPYNFNLVRSKIVSSSRYSQNNKCNTWFFGIVKILQTLNRHWQIIEKHEQMNSNHKYGVISQWFIKVNKLIRWNLNYVETFYALFPILLIILKNCSWLFEQRTLYRMWWPNEAITSATRTIFSNCQVHSLVLVDGWHFSYHFCTLQLCTENI